MKKVILSCEHAGNAIPAQYLPLFGKNKKVLETHRGYDLGAADLFEHLVDLSDFHDRNNISRLLIDLNRSPHHRSLFSEFSRELPESEKSGLIADPYTKYRMEIEKRIGQFLDKGHEVVHFSIHSFTPVLNGKERNADIAFLYDPSRQTEAIVSRELSRYISSEEPGLRMRLNYPYRGVADGLTKYLRQKFTENYMGIEVEVNQKFVANDKIRADIKHVIRRAIQPVVLERK